MKRLTVAAVFLLVLCLLGVRYYTRTKSGGGDSAPQGALNGPVAVLLQACKAEIKEFCGDIEIGPARGRCLKAHETGLSAGCRDTLGRLPPPRPPRQGRGGGAAAPLNAEGQNYPGALLMKACGDDINRFCGGSRRGPAQDKCLKDTGDGLSVECRETMRRLRKYSEVSLNIGSAGAVLAYLRAPGPETLKTALKTCLAVREEYPGGQFNNFLIAFCRHESGDSAGEDRALRAYRPEQKNFYRFIFYEHRRELAGALRFLPSHLERRLRELSKIPETAAPDPELAGPPPDAEARNENETVERLLITKKDNLLIPALFFIAQGFMDNSQRPEFSGLGPEELVSLMGVKEGEAVADIGCGLGYLTFALAARAGAGGRVYAEDIDGLSIQMVRYAAEKGGNTNILPVLGSPADVRLPAGALDKAILLLVYKNILEDLRGRSPEEKDAFFDGFFANIHKALRKDGVLIIADPLVPDLGLSAEAVIRTAEKRNFRFIADKSGAPERYFILLFGKSRAADN